MSARVFDMCARAYLVLRGFLLGLLPRPPKVAVFARAATHRATAAAAQNVQRGLAAAAQALAADAHANGAAKDATLMNSAAAVEAAAAEVVRATAWAALFAGLALSNQHTSVVYVLLMAPSLLWVGREATLGRGAGPAAGALALYAAAALAGLAPYVYLPLAAHAKVKTPC